MQSARDIAIALEAVSGSDVSSVRGAGQPEIKPRRRWYPIAVGLALLVAGAAGGYLAARSLSSRTTMQDFPRYTQLTFRRGEIRNARFTPDGQSVVYSALWDSEPLRVYSVRIDNPRSAAPPIVDAAMLAVSRSGDMAIATRPARLDHLRGSGDAGADPAQRWCSAGSPRARRRRHLFTRRAHRRRSDGGRARAPRVPDRHCAVRDRGMAVVAAILSGWRSHRVPRASVARRRSRMAGGR